MITVPYKALLLALLLFVPSGAATPAGGGPPDKKAILIEEDDSVFTLAGDDPLLLHLDRHGRGYIGVRLIGITSELRVHYGAPRDSGVLVGGVEPESPAAKAGIQVGDIITQADDETIDSVGELSRAVRQKKEGETLKLEIFRDRAKKSLNVTVGERKGKEIELGELRRGPHRRRWILRDLDSMRPLMEPLEDIGGLRDRLEELEKRLKELEKRLPAR